MLSTPRDEDENLLYQQYLVERRALIGDKKLPSDLFDKTLVTLSGGSLGLSLLVLKQIAPTPSVTSLWLLGGAWLGFSIALVIILISFLLSQNAVQRQIDILDSEYNSGTTPSKNSSNRWTWLTGKANVLALIAFVTGVLLFASFSIANLHME